MPALAVATTVAIASPLAAPTTALASASAAATASPRPPPPSPRRLPCPSPPRRQHLVSISAWIQQAVTASKKIEFIRDDDSEEEEEEENEEKPEKDRASSPKGKGALCSPACRFLAACPPHAHLSSASNLNIFLTPAII